MIKSGKISLRWDEIIVEVDGNKVPSNIKSFGNKIYFIGEGINGVIIDGKFNVCREYIHANEEKLFGFISRDEIIEDVIKITLVAGDVIGKIIRIKRKDILNY